jgi:hypothetical protein
MNPNEEVIENHTQLFEWSCIPMAVELVLKLLGRMPSDSFELQKSWGNRHDGSFADFDKCTINGIHFRRQFAVDGGRAFPPEKLTQLFNTIDRELTEARFVIVALAVNGNYHNFVIYDHAVSGEFQATSKVYRGGTWNRSDIKCKITEMAGTDILTYQLVEQRGA